MAQEKHQIGVRLHHCGRKMYPYVSIIGQVAENCEPVTPEEASTIVDNHARLKAERDALLKAAKYARLTCFRQKCNTPQDALEKLEKAIAQCGQEG